MQPAKTTANRNAGHRQYFGSGLFHDVKLGTVSPQAKRVYELLKRDGHVTRITAMHYGIPNVTARITELRAAGINVGCEVAIDANGREYGRWSLSTQNSVAIS